MLSYTDFLFETYGKVKSHTAKENLLVAIGNKMLDESELFFLHHLLNNGYRDRIIEAIDTDNYTPLYEAIEHDAALHESILLKAKERAKAAIAKVKEKGKKALDAMSDGTKALMKLGGNILKPLKSILEKIGEAIKKAWEIGKEKAKAAVEKATEKIRERVKSIIKDGDKKKSLIGELGNMKSMAGAGAKFLTGGFIEDMAKSGEKAATTEENFSYYSYLESSMVQEAANLIDKGYSLNLIEDELSLYNEDDLNNLLESEHAEGGGLKIPFISKLMDKIGHTPPFSWFHDLGKKAETVANNALEKASYMISKIGGPGPFEFALMGALVGVAVAYYTEGGAKSATHAVIHAVEHALHFTIPGLGIVFSIIKYTGLALAIYGIVEAIAGQGEKEGAGKDEDKETKKSVEDKEEPSKEDRKESKKSTEEK